MLDDDGGVISDVVPMTKTFNIAPDFFPMNVVSVSDDVIAFTVEPRICHAGLSVLILIGGRICRG